MIIDTAIKSVCLSAEEMDRAIARMARQIVDSNGGVGNLVLVGVAGRGDVLARLIASAIGLTEGQKPPAGRIDITLYKDDGTARSAPKVNSTDIPFPIDGRSVVLVNDVLRTGCTTRAAMRALGDFGRASRIQLAVLVDQCRRRLPIQADFVGTTMLVAKGENIIACFRETDGFDEVLVQSAGQTAAR